MEDPYVIQYGDISPLNINQVWVNLHSKHEMKVYPC